MKKSAAALLFLFMSSAVLLSADLKTYQTTYEKEMEAIVLEHVMGLTKLNESYQNALNSLHKGVMQAGDLLKIKAVMAESERFITSKSVTADNAKDSSPDLKKIQLFYLQHLESMENGRARNVITLTSKYDSALAALQRSLAQRSKLDDATAVMTEIERIGISDEVVGARALLIKNQEKPKSSAFSPKTLFKTRVYADDTVGKSGLPSRNNIYSIDVEETHRKATFTFWASGDIGLKSNGRVLLITPDSKRHELCKWSPKNFRKTANSVDSYRELRPVVCDVSKLVQDAGTYEFEFKYTHGSHALKILRVELKIR